MVFFTAVNIRKFVVRVGSLAELVDLGAVTPQAATFLEAAVQAGLDILVASGTQAGRTALLNSLGSAVPGQDRIASCGEIFELRTAGPWHCPRHPPRQPRADPGTQRMSRAMTRSLDFGPLRYVFMLSPEVDRFVITHSELFSWTQAFDVLPIVDGKLP